MSFFDTLVGRTRPEQAALLGVPQIVDGIQGRISRESYLHYLAEAYHHVRHTVPLMELARARMDERHGAFVTALDEYIAEETGHEAWILNDIRAAGGDPDQVAARRPGPATQAMVHHAMETVGTGNPMSFFGMVFVLEGVSTQLASQGAEAIGQSLGLGPECFTYLRSPGALDVGHMAFFQGLMEQVDDPADQEAIVAMARRIFVLFAEVFRSIPHRQELAHV